MHTTSYTGLDLDRILLLKPNRIAGETRSRFISSIVRGCTKESEGLFYILIINYESVLRGGLDG